MCTRMWKCGILGPYSGQSLDNVPVVHLRLEAEGPKEAGLGDGMWGGQRKPQPCSPHFTPGQTALWCPGLWLPS